MLAVLLLNRMSAKRRVIKRQKPIKLSKTELPLSYIKSEKRTSREPKQETIYCRTCLNTDDLISIFYDKEGEQKRTEELRLVTGLEIKMDDGLSQKMCSQCLETMNVALQFRRTSKKAEKTLLNLISGKPKKKYSTRLQKAVSKPKPKHKLSKKKLTKKKLAKVEKVEINDYQYEIFSEEFQHQDNDGGDDDKEYQVVIRNVDTVKTKRPSRKKMSIPNSSLYRCSTCDKEFRMKATYKAHMRFHTNYCVCESCGKRCRNNIQLQEHKRARHGLYKIHKCAYCEYSSATKEALIIHERRHTGERPYICDHCGATFHRRSNLVQHIAIHLPEKNFQCDMCPKRLKSRKFLQIHKHNAHTGKRYGYLCGICEHRFEKPNKVRAHTRRVHGVPDEHQGPVVRVQM